jgi:hypothetical protein
MTSAYNNRTTVTLGGREYTLVATKNAEKIYGDRFRDDLESLGPSGAYTHENVKRTVQEADEDGNTIERDVTEVVTTELVYTGRLKGDLAISSMSRVTGFGDVPYQVFAAAWAMATAAGSIDEPYDTWFANLPSNVSEDIALWRAVCVDLCERAFFWEPGGQTDAGKPDAGEADKKP